MHLLKNKDGIVIVFMISSCWGGELHTTTKTAEMLDDSQGTECCTGAVLFNLVLEDKVYNGVTRLHSEST